MEGIISSSSIMGTTNTTAKETVIGGEVKKLNNAIDLLMTRIHTLAEDLHPILSKLGPEDVPEEQKEGRTLSPLAMMIIEDREKINTVTRIIEDIVARMEL